MPAMETTWPHAPRHQLSESGTFLVTVGTYKKLPHFLGGERLGVLQRGLLHLASEWGWQIEAWAIFCNHYHFVAHSPPAETTAASLRPMLSALHARTARWINRKDKTPGRQVWHNYWETRLTYEKSYLARLSYVHHNAVKHGLVAVACQYPWCSAGWFETHATPAQRRTLAKFKTDRLNVLDAFDVSGPW